MAKLGATPRKKSSGGGGFTNPTKERKRDTDVNRTFALLYLFPSFSTTVGECDGDANEAVRQAVKRARCLWQMRITVEELATAV